MHHSLKTREPRIYQHTSSTVSPDPFLFPVFSFSPGVIGVCTFSGLVIWCESH